MATTFVVVLLLQPRSPRGSAAGLGPSSSSVDANGTFSFSEDFTSDVLKDPGTTADWDTADGQLRLSAGTGSFVKADNTTPGSNFLSTELGSSTFFVDFVRMAIDARGYPHIVWPDDTNGGIPNVQYVTWGGSAWVNAAGVTATSSNTAVSADAAFAGRPDIDLDSAGRPGVAWWSSTGVEFARWDPDLGTWHGMASTSSSDLLEATVVGSAQPQFQFDSNDFPVITWGEPTTHVTRWNGTTYTNMAGAPGSDVIGTTGGAPQLELDANDNPHVVFVADPAGPTTVSVMFTKWTGSATGWVGNITTDGNPATIDTDRLNDIFGQSFSNTPAVALTPNGRGAASWVGVADGDTHVFSTEWDGASAYVRLDGTSGANIIGSATATYPEIEYTTDGRQTVSWTEAPGGTPNIYYVEQDGTIFVGVDGSPSATVVNGSPAVSPSYFEMELDCQDNPAFAWGDLFFADSALNYTHWLTPYAASNAAMSTTVDTTTDNITSATLSVTQDACSAGSTVYELSNDGGAMWSVVTPGVAHTFAQTGSNLMWRASLSNNANPGESPVIDSLSISYSTPTPQSVPPAADARIDGSNPIELAINASVRAFPTAGSAQTVVLGRSDNLVDEFVATPLVSLTNASLLLTQPTALDGGTLAEINRVLAVGGRIYVLGGTEAISQAVVDALAANGRTNVVRLGGESRRETAVAVAGEIDARNPSPATKAFVTEHLELVDAFAVGPAAGDMVNGTVDVILLSDRGSGTLHPSTLAYLQTRPQLTSIEVIGGAAALPDALDDDIRTKLPALTLLRRQGVNRFATNRAINEVYFSAPATAVLANGQANRIPGAVEAGSVSANGLFSALLAGSFATKVAAPLVLVQATQLPAEARGYLEAHAATLETIYVVGSTTDVSDAVLQQAQSLI